MKKNRMMFIVFAMSLIFLSGCTKKSATDKSGSQLIDGTQKETGSTGETQYKLLYDPPSGGSPENIGKILFASDDGKTTNADYDLYTINPDGSGKTRLTNFGKFIDHPVWSPEHSRITYSAHVDEGNTDKIFIMTADGSEKRQLTFGTSRDKFPTWSPDGKQIAYISYQNDIPNLFVIDTHGENQKQLTFVDGKNTVLWPSWSPVSDTIAFSYNKAGNEIDFRLQVIKSDGTGQKEILSSNDKDLSDHEPAWSPDGKKMYFLSNRTRNMEIWKLDYDKWEQGVLENKKLDGKDIGLMQVSNLHAVNNSPDHRPRVSPDGKKIVFYGVGSDWNNIGTNLYTMNIDGTNLTNITKSIDGNEWPDW
jgi:Tol biopolymer transport system component